MWVDWISFPCAKKKNSRPTKSHRHHQEGAVERRRCTSCKGEGMVDQFCQRQKNSRRCWNSQISEDVHDLIAAGVPVVEDFKYRNHAESQIEAAPTTTSGCYWLKRFDGGCSC